MSAAIDIEFAASELEAVAGQLDDLGGRSDDPQTQHVYALAALVVRSRAVAIRQVAGQ